MKQLNKLFSVLSAKPLMLLSLFALLPTLVNAQCPDDNHPHMIDLGLPSGTKWACCNVGAQKPEDYGGYFAWGETEEKNVYDWSTYIHCDGSQETCHDIGDIAGTQYDAATANWGSPWVMPSLDQMNELKDNCTSEWTTENGVIGRRFTGPNGGSIFIPAAGYREDDLYDTGHWGGYWSSTHYEYAPFNTTYLAWYFHFYSGDVGRNGIGRDSGLSVRPVVSPSSTPSGIAINETNFPDENFRNWVLAQDYGQDGVLSKKEIAGVTIINVAYKGIAQMKGIEYFTAMEYFVCRGNRLTTLDLSKNTKLKEVVCSMNNIKGAAMDALIAGLPETGGKLYAYDRDIYEQNVITKAQAAAAKEKGWIPYCGNDEYEGFDPVTIDEANFPDENFRNWILTHDFDYHADIEHYGLDGMLTENEIAAIEDVDVSGQNISDLKGIEYFTALKELICNNNQLTTLDVSGFEALEVLSCSRNQLTTLDVTNNPELLFLECGINKLTELEVSMNTRLRAIECSDNRITWLYLSKNTALERLDCSHNGLWELDLSKNTALKHLNCNANQFYYLDVSGCSALKILDCRWNYLTELDLSKNLALNELWCSNNHIYGAAMDALIAGLPDTGGDFYAYFPYEPEYNVVTKAQVAAAKEKGWTTYKQYMEEYEGSDPVVEGIAINETNFPDENFRNWVLAQEYGQDGVLTEDEISAITGIAIINQNITDLTGIEHFAALNVLRCDNNKLTELDVSKNTNLQQLYCSGNQLTEVDVSKNSALEVLNCSNNQLTALDVSKNAALHWLGCFNNQIKGAAMDALIASLPETGGKFYAIAPNDSGEQNVVTKSQVAAAKEKGWTTYTNIWNQNLGGHEEYESGEPEMEPISNGESIDIGNQIDENTDIDGNVVGDIYYSISSGNGNYNAAEGCVVVTKPTDDNAIDGKDIFGEDFKDNYTGIVFKLAPGKGTIKVEAETQGDMMLKVKIGNNDPIEMELNGKLKVKFPYNVSEPTYVYIYGGLSDAAGAKAMGAKRAKTLPDLLKLYSFEITSEQSGIEAVDNGQQTDADAPIYNLNGQRVNKAAKGVFIKNGRKVLVK